MEAYSSGDRVRLDIPDETDPDHAYHGKHGEIIELLEDDAGLETGDKADGIIYRVRLDDDTVLDFRAHDLRPPIH
ncbi:hypothetical protein [Halorubellus sp. PRR65]|uniref:hypothetical protein n=1 Tax=Halorubellus sp. PRR65 TaxID=3098148 RepID=UPI002B25CB3A|nr:hypothetical protein [Halorubellus sp. PRR65]